MNYFGGPILVALSLCVLACDPSSKEIGSTVGETSDDPTGEASLDCESITVQTDCDGLTTETEEYRCAWVEVFTSDTACSEDSPPQGRCITTEYYGDGCIASHCVGDEAVYRRHTDDGAVEWFSTSEFACGYEPADYPMCDFDGVGADLPPECACICEGLGGGVAAQACDPLGDPCPDTAETSQECEPNPQGDGWVCAPQYAGTSPGYGDDCWPEDAPAGACFADTTCLPNEGLGVADCDGGEGGGCCAQLCDLSLDTGVPCPDEGQLCIPFYGEADPPEGYEHVGVCRLP